MRGRPAEEAFDYHYRLGQVLAQLREENVLIVASGTAVHNLRDLGVYMRSKEVAPYVAPFDALLDKVALAEVLQPSLTNWRLIDCLSVA